MTWLSENTKCPSCQFTYAVEFSYLGGAIVGHHSQRCGNCGTDFEFDVEKNIFGEFRVRREDDEIILFEKADGGDHCPECGGSGIVEYDEIGQVGFEYDYVSKQATCPRCEGRGNYQKKVFR